jgi:hypothetical protein
VASPKRRELLAFTAALLAAVALLPLSGARVLWTRPFWMDEQSTYWVTDHRSPIDMIRHIAIGGEWSPPLLHFIVWTARSIAGDLSPVLLRSIVLACVLVALVFVYATLRRRFDRATSLAGWLVVAGSPLVILHAFDGRMYAPWLASAAFYAWALGADASAPRSRRRDLTQGAAAVLLCTVHWFGVLSLGLMAAGVYLVLRRDHVDLRQAARYFLPSAAGIVALMICAPLAISQRIAASGVLWVPSLSAPQFEVVINELFPVWAVLLVAVLFVVSSATRRDIVHAEASPGHVRLFDAGTAALAALVFMPVVVAGISIFQPSMLPRYSVVATLGWGALIALTVEMLGAWQRVVAIVVLFLLLARHLAVSVEEKQRYAAAVGAHSRGLERARAMGLPVVFQSLHAMYPAAIPRSGAPQPALYLFVPDSVLDVMYPPDRPGLKPLRRHYGLERDIGREHRRLYGFPTLTTPAALDSLPTFALVGTDASLPTGYTDVQRWGSVVFPNHKVRRVSRILAVFER